MHWHIGKWFFPRQIFVGLALLAMAGTAAAQQPSDDYWKWELTPFYGYMAGGEFEDPSTNTDRDLDEDNSFGLIVNAAVDQWRHYEFLYVKQGTQVDGTVPMDLDVEYLQIGGTVSGMESERFIPYFGITVGAARFSPDQSGLDTETKLAFSVGAGVKVPITDHIGVRFDARAFVSLLDTDGNLFCVSDNGAGTCGIRAKSDTFLQYQAGLGVIVGF
ncbi:outer membrane beta-barrel protein [Steroidobacter sp.]|uniref:outer membrane beta-barrel protein n=1 Tax=Steroidobacter sp. TaxID=1978227 RepID=UPI001A61EDC8|nr:outer membrane beta-barrel protein [Steroidobacter sp.]MBL8269779.1 outer membrane beta-barrel protein [Steroidobacter sp.]